MSPESAPRSVVVLLVSLALVTAALAAPAAATTAAHGDLDETTPLPFPFWNGDEDDQNTTEQNVTETIDEQNVPETINETIDEQNASNSTAVPPAPPIAVAAGSATNGTDGPTPPF